MRPTEAVFTDEDAACAHAKAVSTDAGVLAGSVTRFALDRLGERRAVAMYVGGVRQSVPYVSDDRNINGGGRSR